MDPNQQPQNPVPQPQQPPQQPITPPAAPFAPLTPQPVPELFGTAQQDSFTQPVVPVQPVGPTQVPQPTQTFEQPQQNTHFPADHPVPDGSVVKGDNPGKVLGVVGFILVFVGLGLISLILGIIGLKKSKQAGHKNGFALAAIILGIVQMIAAIIIASLLTIVAVTLVNTCSELGSGTHVLTDGRTVTCDI